MTYFPDIKNLGDIVRHHARERPDAPALLFDDRRADFRTLDARTTRAANALITAGLKPGERIAFLGKNSDHYFELLFAAAKAGIVMVPVSWRLAPPEIAYILKDAEARLLFADEILLASIAESTDQLPVMKARIAMEKDYVGWRDAQPAREPKHTVSPQDVVLQLYTSGTTGNPKGVQLTHWNFLSLCSTRQGWEDWTEEDCVLIAMPVFHIAGSGMCVRGLYSGASNVILREFDPDATLRAVARHGVTQLFLVPAALHRVLNLPKARSTDYSRLKIISYGASPIPLELLREAINCFGCGFVQFYGMTETTGSVTALAPEDHDANGNARMRSAGRPFPGIDIAILDEAGERVPTGTIGEVYVRSPTNMPGYWKLPEATAKTLRDDGFLRTGDAGYLDADGYLYIHDRVKDMIISGAENIYPAEVENAIFGHPAVADVAVIGIPSERWGEEVKALVVKKPGAAVTEGELIAFARERIAHFKAPKSVDFIDALPRNPSGKILKRELRKPYWEGRERQVN